MKRPLQFGPLPGAKPPRDPFNVSEAEKERARLATERAKKAREEYDQQQRGGVRVGTSKYGPTGGRL